MWFDPADPRALFVDIRSETVQRSPGAQAKRFEALEVRPDVQADFTALPFADESYALVVFDPPHMTSLGEKSFMAKEYGRLFGDWRDMLRKGFAECFRVLRPAGTLIFKWNEYDVAIAEVLALTPEKPLFGHKSGKTSKTHWVVFFKSPSPSEDRAYPEPRRGGDGVHNSPHPASCACDRCRARRDLSHE